jgi:hypothetical protein
MRRFAFTLLALAACHRPVAAPAPGSLMASAAITTPIRLTDGNGNFVGVNDAGAMQVTGLASGSYNLAGDVTGTTTANTAISFTGNDAGAFNFDNGAGGLSRAPVASLPFLSLVSPNNLGLFTSATGFGFFGSPDLSLGLETDGEGSGGQLTFISAGYDQLFGGIQIEINTPLFSLYDYAQNPVVNFTNVYNGASSEQFANTVTSYTINYANGIGASATGGFVSLQAQNETGTTSTGGVLNLSSGTGTTKSGATNVEVGGNNVWTFDDNGPGPNPATIPLTNANVSLSAAQARAPMQIYTGTLTGSVSLIYPNAAKIWFADIGALVLGGNTLTFKSGTGSCTAITSLVTQSQVFMIVGSGLNTCHINI